MEEIKAKKKAYREVVDLNPMRQSGALSKRPYDQAKKDSTVKNTNWGQKKGVYRAILWARFHSCPLAGLAPLGGFSDHSRPAVNFLHLGYPLRKLLRYIYLEISWIQIRSIYALFTVPIIPYISNIMCLSCARPRGVGSRDQ